jgi:hypothetical protein
MILAAKVVLLAGLAIIYGLIVFALWRQSR